MQNANTPPREVEFSVDYVPAIEGPVGMAARMFWRERRPAVPNEASVRNLQQRAYLNGYILRTRYDDHVRRVTRLTFRRRPRYPHPPDADFLP